MSVKHGMVQKIRDCRNEAFLTHPLSSQGSLVISGEGVERLQETEAWKTTGSPR